MTRNEMAKRAIEKLEEMHKTKLWNCSSEKDRYNTYRKANSAGRRLMLRDLAIWYEWRYPVIN